VTEVLTDLPGSDDYLEDVQLKEIAPICDHPLDNIYADMLRRSGMKFDTNAERVEFLGEMTRLSDTVKNQLARQQSASESVGSARPEAIARMLRDRLSAGESIFDLALEFPSLAHCVRALKANQPSIMETWSTEQWEQIEDALLDKSTRWSIRLLANTFGLRERAARNLLSWYR
jgi:hypothetical protein